MYLRPYKRTRSQAYDFHPQCGNVTTDRGAARRDTNSPHSTDLKFRCRHLSHIRRRDGIMASPSIRPSALKGRREATICRAPLQRPSWGRHVSYPRRSGVFGLIRARFPYQRSRSQPDTGEQCQRHKFRAREQPDSVTRPKTPYREPYLPRRVASTAAGRWPGSISAVEGVPH